MEIRVTDTGIGIKDEFKAKLFQPFEQADSGNSRSYGGTGIGLYISRNYAKAMGGNLKLESTSPTGTTFLLEIPLELPEPSMETD
jgi:signal transduction histidine kinase